MGEEKREEKRREERRKEKRREERREKREGRREKGEERREKREREREREKQAEHRCNKKARSCSFCANFPKPNIADQVSDEIVFSLSTAFPITCSAFSASFETFDIFFTALSPSKINSVKLISERFSYIFFFDVCSVFLMFGTFQQK